MSYIGIDKELLRFLLRSPTFAVWWNFELEWKKKQKIINELKENVLKEQK